MKRSRRRRIGGVISTEESLLRIMSRAPYVPGKAVVEIHAKFRLEITAASIAVKAGYLAYLGGDNPSRIAATPTPSQLVREVVVALRKESLRQRQEARDRDAGLPGQLQLPVEGEVDHASD